MTRYRFAESTVVEPLVSSFGAWWMTVAPVPAALHLTHFQLPLLRSYLQNPEFHLRAATDPAMRGTAFIGLPLEDRPAVQALLAQTLTSGQPALALAAAVEEVTAQLLADAKGQSLEPRYRTLPPPLRGMVELVYDYNNRAFLRVIEGAAYRSSAYDPSRQSLRICALQDDAHRPSLWSTPRVGSSEGFDWNVPFADPRVDALFALDTSPMELDALIELFGAGAPDVKTLRSYLTDEAPRPPPPRFRGPGIRARYLGHASVLLEWDGYCVLTDALISPVPIAGGADRMTYADLPERINAVLITHSHADHFVLETLLRLRHRIDRLVVAKSHGLLIGDVSLAGLSRQLGFREVVELDSYDSVRVGSGEVFAAPFLGEHGDVAHSKSAWVVQAAGQRVLFAADSACVDDELYRTLRRAVGQIHTVFLNTETEGSPLGFGQEALFPRKRDRRIERDRRCRGSNAEEGMRLLEAVGATRAFNYAMGLEPWLEFILGPPPPDDAARMRESDALLASAGAKGISAQRLRGPSTHQFGE